MLQSANLLLKLIPVEEIVNADTVTGGLGGVGWANTLTSGTNGLVLEFHLLEAIDELVEVEDNMSAVGKEYAVGGVEALVLDGLELGEEGGDVDDASGSNKVEAVGVDETCCRSDDVSQSILQTSGPARRVVNGILTRRKHMEIIANTVHDNSVPGIVSSSGSSADIDLVAEDIDELSLALISPLGTKHNGSHAGWLGYFVLFCFFCCELVVFRFNRQRNSSRKDVRRIKWQQLTML